MSRLRGPHGALTTLLRGRRAAEGGIVLGYHDVLPMRTSRPWDVSSEQLVDHIDAVRQAGFEIVPMSAMARELAAGRPVARLAAVTFDDALVGVLDAVKMLGKRSVPVTVYATCSSMGRSPSWWPDARRVLTALELRRVAGLEHVEIGSHSWSHLSLVDVDDETLRREICDSRRYLSTLVEAPVETFAYPSGHHDARVRAATRRAGYLGAVTFQNGRVATTSDRFALPRFTGGAHLSRARFRYHLLRPAQAWPDIESVTVASA
ncbi:MAG: polysaccharide deacetylase family protein [Actinomycetota bacterium]